MQGGRVSGTQIVEDPDVVSLSDQMIGQSRTQETRSTGDQNPQTSLLPPLGTILPEPGYRLFQALGQAHLGLEAQ